MKRPRILLADDHAIVLEGLRRILNRPEFELVGAVNSGRTLLEAAASLQPDVIIADIGMPSPNGIEAARKLHKQDPKPKIIFLTMHPELAYANAAFAAGASGYVLKTAAGEELIEAIHCALNGQTYISKAIAQVMEQAYGVGSAKDQAPILTPRQREVLQLLAEGRLMKEAGDILNLTPRTVAFHKYAIMERMGLKTGAELVQYAVEHHIVPPRG
jgi:DNA-binding NarL/FixJ family response regulator